MPIHPTGPLAESYDKDLQPPYTIDSQRRIEAIPKNSKWKHLSAGIEKDDVDKDGRPVPKWKLYYARAMIPLAILFHAFGAIQAYEIYSSQNASGVSLAAYVVYVISAMTWFCYGAFVLVRRNLIIMLSSMTAFTLGVIILVGIILYGGADAGGNDANNDPM